MTSKGDTRHYTKDQRDAILEELNKPGETTSKVGARHGLDINIIGRWRREKYGKLNNPFGKGTVKPQKKKQLTVSHGFGETLAAQTTKVFESNKSTSNGEISRLRAEVTLLKQLLSLYMKD